MADNVTITPGVGASVAADEVGGQLYQRVKPTFGDDGVATDVSQTNPLPVDILSGELFSSIENLRAALDILNRRMQINRINAAGEQSVVLSSNSSMGSINNVTTLSTLTNFGSVPATDSGKALSRMAYNTGVRANLTFS